MSYNRIPASASLNLKPYTAQVSDEHLNDFKQLIKCSKIGPKTYENLKDDRFFGVSRDWLTDAKRHWQNDYDWRKTEARINSIPNFTASIEYQGDNYDIHFAALFSEKPGATVITFLHGWPGSFLEFLGVLETLKKKYRPEELPFHVIVPSLPGYAYSSGPPLDKDFTTVDASHIIDKLMVGLGFGDGYIAQGGDVGSFVCRVLGVTSKSCKAVHLNMSPTGKPDGVSKDDLPEDEKAALVRGPIFQETGNAYAREHGTRPATIGLVLSTSPVALLAWIGEKFLTWTDADPPLDEILDSVTLYWLTDSFPRCIYPYRSFIGPGAISFHRDPKYYLQVPTGYSWFPKEISPTPISYVEKTCNLVWSKKHTAGGHFAAMERPQAFVEDMEDFVKTVLKQI